MTTFHQQFLSVSNQPTLLSILFINRCTKVTGTRGILQKKSSMSGNNSDTNSIGDYQSLKNAKAAKSSAVVDCMLNGNNYFTLSGIAFGFIAGLIL